MPRIDAEIRVKAFTLFKELKNEGLFLKDILKEVDKRFRTPYSTLRDWSKNKCSPFGKRRIKYHKELFYVLGALLGDGYLYSWKRGYHTVGVVGEKEFIDKYAKKISVCIGRKVKGYINRSNNVWFVNIGNIELFYLFKGLRENLDKLNDIIRNGDYRKNSLQFIEGFFDAEGCVKVIKEKTRKTPKICLDICNTNYAILEVIRILLKEQFDIESNYSIQEARVGRDGFMRKKLYHLRIYRKDSVNKFFQSIRTTKLKAEKAHCLAIWLNNSKLVLEHSTSY